MPVEDVDAFRARAREWIRENLLPRSESPAASVGSVLSEEEELAAVAHERSVQRRLFEAGFAGITIAPEYGGQGLTVEHQRAFVGELLGYEYPSRFQVPTFTPCASVLLDFGTEEQKVRHLPAILRGEELWMQLLSEPSGGSDVAGALTSAVRDGDEWVLNGSKIWTTGAWWSDWGLCLARTNWDVPKHRGLTVFTLPLHQTGITISKIEMLNGSKEFCQEFLDDVRVPDADRIGAVDDGWSVAIRWLFHERMLYNSPLVSQPADASATYVGTGSSLEVARDAGRLDDPVARDLVGEARTLQLVGGELQRRIIAGVGSGLMHDQAAAITRLFSGAASARSRTIAFELADAAGAVWADEDGTVAGSGPGFLMRQSGSIGGGTTEMARNVISERVLGMPRERAGDRDIAFRDVPRGGQRPE
jgi:alkylation response protein AidB-like acyl-CoA dehydrogenase